MVRVSERLAAAVLGAVPGYMPARASSVAEGVDRVFAFVLCGVSTKTYSRMTTLDPGAAPLRIQVTARKWSWWFDHPGGKGAGELHLVVGRPTELVMASADVIHSLYVPDFRLKQDVVPGRFTRMTFTPVLPGTFPVVCAEFCGTDHSRMSAMATVHPDQASFDAWAREGVAPAASLVELGKKVFLSKGCVGCHSTDGSPRVGVMYLVAIAASLFLGGVFALVLRLNLWRPAGGLVSKDAYNKLFTLHGAVMIFLFVIPGIPAALGNFVVPLQLGAKDLAFPKVNLLSFWLYVVGAVPFIAVLVAGGI